MEDGRAMTVGFVVVGLPLSIKLDSVALSEYRFGVSLCTVWILDVVGMNLYD